MVILHNCTDEFKHKDRPALEKWAFVGKLWSHHLKLDNKNKGIHSKHFD